MDKESLSDASKRTEYRKSLERTLKRKFKQQLGIHYRRTIAQDYQLLEDTMTQELNDRAVSFCENRSGRVEHRMLFVMEADTDYGRSFKEIITQPSKECVINQSIVSYLRGVDGVAPDQGMQNDANNGNDSYNNKSQASGSAARTDYFRRLASITASRDSHIEMAAARTVTAGIFGSDIYDKLLILEMMKQQYPDALYFTTDLDTELFEHGRSQWSRNLIVVSGYGLTPRQSDFTALGLSTPDHFGHNRSFRSSYQTSLYLAA